MRKVRGTERLSNLLKITQLENDIGGIRTKRSDLDSNTRATRRLASEDISGTGMGTLMAVHQLSRFEPLKYV